MTLVKLLNINLFKFNSHKYIPNFKQQKYKFVSKIKSPSQVYSTIIL